MCKIDNFFLTHCVFYWSSSYRLASSVTYSISLSKETKLVFTHFSGETFRSLQIRAVTDQLHGAKLKTIYSTAKPLNPFVKKEKLYKCATEH
jgi:hypothetical protein